MAEIDELKIVAGQIKNATRVGENTAERVGGAFELAANLLESAVGTVSSFKVLGSIDELPDKETTFGYIVGEEIFVWVGTGGDTKGGKYKNCGKISGKDGVGIESITQTDKVGSNVRNTITITLTNGDSYNVFVYNGSQGENGVSLGDVVLSQEYGYNENAVISQKALTDKLVGRMKYPQDQFDSSKIVGKTLSGNSASQFKFVDSATDKAYVCEIPSGVTNISIKEVGEGEGYLWSGFYFFDEGMNPIMFPTFYGKNAVNIFSIFQVPENAKFYGITMKTAQSEVSSLTILYNIPFGEVFPNNTYTGVIGSAFTNNFNYILQHKDDIEIDTHNLLQYCKGDSISNTQLSVRVEVGGGLLLLYGFVSFDSTKKIIEAYDNSDNLIYTKMYYGDNSNNEVSFGENGLAGANSKWRSFILPNETKYVKINIMRDANNKSYLELIGNAYANHLYHYKMIALGKETKLFKKKIACFGDSITSFGSTASDSYAWKMFDNYACEVRNYGRGSAHFIDYANTDTTYDQNPGESSQDPKNVVSTQLRWMKSEGFVPDIAIISGCTNDAYSAVQLGDIDAEFSQYPNTSGLKNDFAKMCVYAVSMLREVNPKMQIFFATPIRSLDTSQMARLKQYVQAFKTCAEKLGCVVIDWHNESGIIEKPSEASSNPFFTDILHPSQIGTDAMLECVMRYIY